MTEYHGCCCPETLTSSLCHTSLTGERGRPGIEAMITAHRKKERPISFSPSEWPFVISIIDGSIVPSDAQLDCHNINFFMATLGQNQDVLRLTQEHEQAGMSKPMSEWTSEWPRTYVPIFGCSDPLCIVSPSHLQAWFHRVNFPPHPTLFVSLH